MVNKAKNWGTRAETAVKLLAQQMYWPDADRRILGGSTDRGDVFINPKIVIEVKATATPSYPQYLRETEAERLNAGADYGFLVHKPQGMGNTRVASWPALMEIDAWHHLRERAGLKMTEFAEREMPARGTHPGPTLLALDAERVLKGCTFMCLFYPKVIVPYAAMPLNHMFDIIHLAGYGPATYPTPKEVA